MMALDVLVTGSAGHAGRIPSYWVWAYWVNPLSYAFKALSLLEFSAPRWQTPFHDATNPDIQTLGDAVLDTVSLNISRHWIGFGYIGLACFIVAYNVLLILAMTFLSCMPPLSLVIDTPTQHMCTPPSGDCA